jgi:hypothetical protein
MPARRGHRTGWRKLFIESQPITDQHGGGMKYRAEIHDPFAQKIVEFVSINSHGTPR